jgi:biotin-(acetyl-CoA carboxylase) ligase
MPPKTRRAMPFSPELVLPPPFTLFTLREVGDAFEHAVAIAPEQGAGALVHVGRFDLAEFAVVLEPDEPLKSARRAFYAAMAALADALIAYAPPEKPVTIDWPDAIRVDGGLVGGGRLAWLPNASEDEPCWLVFGATIRTVAMGESEPGVYPLAAALEEEGFADFGASQLVESFARHLMVHVDAWQEHGFPAVARAYLARLARDPGVRRTIDENGDLIVRRVANTEVERRNLVAALITPAWLDPATGGPRR